MIETDSKKELKMTPLNAKDVTDLRRNRRNWKNVDRSIKTS